MNILEYAIAKKMFGGGESADVWDESFTIVGTPEEGGGGDDDESMVGLWVFNDVINSPNNDFELSFTDGFGDEYVEIEIRNNALWYSVEVDDLSTPAYLFSNNEWEEKEYKTLNILEEPSAEAAEWIRANAKKQGVPKAYHLSSADELPTDAVDGSLAVVEDNNLVGIWVLNDELTKFVDTEEEAIIVNVDFYCFDFPQQQYDGMIDSGSYPHIRYLLNGEEISDVYDDGWYICNDGGNAPEHFLFNKIVITKNPTDEIFRNWLPLNGRRMGGSPYTLYSRENGEWVNKGEI